MVVVVDVPAIAKVNRTCDRQTCRSHRKAESARTRVQLHEVAFWMAMVLKFFEPLVHVLWSDNSSSRLGVELLRYGSVVMTESFQFLLVLEGEVVALVGRHP